MEVAALYGRISLDRVGAGLGLERQFAENRKLAQRKGWTHIREYGDNDISAYSGKRRPAFEQMLTDAGAGQLNAIVVWHIDRLTRQPVELERIINLADQHGLELATVEGDVDLATPVGRMMARIIGATARYESEHKSARQRLAIEQAARAGKTHGGPRPYGYNADQRTIYEPEAAVIRMLSARVLAGETIGALCKSLTAAGQLTSRGNPWQDMTMRRMLTSPRIAGMRDHKGVSFPAAWPPIIAAETHAQLCVALESRPKGPPRRYLLTGGLVTCAECGCPLFAHSTWGAPAYLCAARYRWNSPDGQPSCGKVRFPGLLLEEHIATLALARVASPAGRRALKAATAVGGDAAAAAAQLNAAEQTLVEIAADFGAGLMSRSERLAARGPALARLTKAQAQLQSTSGLPPLPASFGVASLAAWWDAPGTSIAAKRSLIKILFRKIEVTRPKKAGERPADLGRVRYEWA